MIIGVPKEIKNHEYRVGLTPNSVKALVQQGHQVFVETQAGKGIGFSDSVYEKAGAHISFSAATLFADAELIVKVKEPQPSEYALLQPNQLLFTYLHLAAEPLLTQALLARHVTAIGYETITDDAGNLPLLTPMSEIAGRMAIQAGAQALERTNGGAGILLVLRLLMS